MTYLILYDWFCSVKPGRHVLVTVSEQGANIGGRMYISFIKRIVSTAFILSIAKPIQPEFLYDIKTGVFFVGTAILDEYRRKNSSDQPGVTMHIVIVMFLTLNVSLTPGIGKNVLENGTGKKRNKQVMNSTIPKWKRWENGTDHTKTMA